MSFEPQRDYDAIWAFAISKKQVDYATVLADTDLTKSVPVRVANTAQLTQTKLTDEDWFGKGHADPTFQRTSAQDVALSVDLPLSTEMLGWALSYVMGKVTTDAGPPIVHTFDYADPAVSKQMPVATVYEEVSEGIKRRLHSLACQQLAISFENLQFVGMQAQFIGSGQVTDGASAQAITQQSQNLMVGGEVDVQIGPIGTPLTVAERVRRGSITITPNLAVNWGRNPGSGLFHSKMWFTRHRVTLSLDVAVKDDDDLQALYLGDTPREIQIIGTIDANNDATFLFPQARFTNLGIVSEDNFKVYRIEANMHFRGTAAASPDVPFQALVKNTIAGYLT